MNVKWVNSSSVLSWMYCAMSESSIASALVYAVLPLPPGTSPSWTPPSSLYCCQKSVSKISAADRKRRIDSSPSDSRCRRRAEASGTSANRPAPSAPAPVVAMNERRLLRNRALSADSPVSGASPSRLPDIDSDDRLDEDASVFILCSIPRGWTTRAETPADVAVANLMDHARVACPPATATRSRPCTVPAHPRRRGIHPLAVDRRQPPDCVRQQPTRSCSTPRHDRPRQLPPTSFAGTPAPDKPHGPDGPAVTSPDALSRPYLPAETRRSSQTTAPRF